MKSFFYIIFNTIIFVLLTVVTQVGGVIFIGSILLKKWLKTRFLLNKYAYLLVFPLLYLVLTITIIPVLARQFGRVPMPVFSNEKVKPVTIWTCILNRHYVRKDLKTSVENVANELNNNFEHSIIAYLDAGLPFLDGFPLIPHLSHKDGRRLDLAFFYLDKKTGKSTNEKPAFSGYGVFENPKENERNRTEECKTKGFWQYDFTKHMTLGSNSNDFTFDESKTKQMVMLFSKDKNIDKMLIEPHLKTRLGLENDDKIRLHGCQAVRHDDHLHIELKK